MDFYAPNNISGSDLVLADKIQRNLLRFQDVIRGTLYVAKLNLRLKNKVKRFYQFVEELRQRVILTPPGKLATTYVAENAPIDLFDIFQPYFTVKNLKSILERLQQVNFLTNEEYVFLYNFFQGTELEAAYRKYVGDFKYFELADVTESNAEAVFELWDAKRFNPTTFRAFKKYFLKYPTLFSLEFYIDLFESEAFFPDDDLVELLLSVENLLSYQEYSYLSVLRFVYMALLQPLSNEILQELGNLLYRIDDHTRNDSFYLDFQEYNINDIWEMYALAQIGAENTDKLLVMYALARSDGKNSSLTRIRERYFRENILNEPFADVTGLSLDFSKEGFIEILGLLRDLK